MSARVLHVDIDAFFASVEQIRNPDLKGKPVAVGSGVIASASYEARRFGLRAGMTLRRAQELCPELVVITGHAHVYRCFGEVVFKICAKYSPALETYLDEAYCDWSGMERLYPDPVAVAHEIREQVFREVGLTISAGIGRNRMFAKMASKRAKPGTALQADSAQRSVGVRRRTSVDSRCSQGVYWIRPEEEERFLVSLPVGRLPGIGPKTEKLFRKLNIRTVGTLRTLSLQSLQGMMGSTGRVIHERARGEDTQPISAREVPRSIRRETTFHTPTMDPEIIEGTLYYLLERAAGTLRQLRLEARQVGVKIRYEDFEDPAQDTRDVACIPEGGVPKDGAPGIWPMGKGQDLESTGVYVEDSTIRKLAAPTQLDSELFAAALRIFRSLYMRRVALRLIGVTLTGFAPETGLIQLDLFDSIILSRTASTSPDPHSRASCVNTSQEVVAHPEALLSTARAEPAPTPRRPLEEWRLLERIDAIRRRYGYSAVVCGKSLHLLGKLPQDDHGFILRTSCLTR